MDRPPRLLRVLLMRTIVLTLVTWSAGLLLYSSLGVTSISAVLFALACAVGSMLASLIV
jgi:hypothetical protein